MGSATESQQSPMMIEFEKCVTTGEFTYQLRVRIKKTLSVMQALNL